MTEYVPMKRFFPLVFTILLAAGIVPAAFGRDAAHYAQSSVLAEGNWRRVRISETGMHVISASDLRSMGFTDPGKVHVYGTGGTPIDFGLTASDPDDLPLVPSIRLAKGIVFFAHALDRWDPTPGGETPYRHQSHPYATETYYWLSDRPLTPKAQRELNREKAGKLIPGAENPLKSFTARVLHEKEMDHATEYGYIVLGEDFRTNRKQNFPFELTDKTGEDVTALVRFMSKTTGGTSSLLISADGKRLPSDNRDKIPATTDTEGCGMLLESVKKIQIDGNGLVLGLEYSNTGALFLARLDYIEVFYTRKLQLNKGELHFYGNWHPGEGVEITGCSETTRIWDVTDPAAPAEVEFALTGDKARFGFTASAYREFIAFNPESVSRNAWYVAGQTANQDIHAMEVPDMVILTLPEYRSGAERIAAMHERVDSMLVHVLDVQKVYNEFSGGIPDFMAFRRLLKMFHDRGSVIEQGKGNRELGTEPGRKLRYCLLMGKPTYDNKMVSAAVKNAGYTPMPIFQVAAKYTPPATPTYAGTSSNVEERSSWCNDDLIGMLDDVNAKDFKEDISKIHIAVGRIPVSSAAEADAFAAKLEKYVENPEYGPWRSKVMLIADDDDNGVHLNQSQQVYANMRSRGNGESIVYDRLYLDSYPRVMSSVGATYPQATKRMLNNYNDGVMFTNYIGHASETGWGHEHLWEWKDIVSMANRNPTFIYAATCRFAYWDKPMQSAAELLLLNPDGGVIGFMAATRTVFVDQNGKLNSATAIDLFNRDNDGRALRFGDVYLKGKNRYYSTNNLRYSFIGDPAMRVPSPQYNVNVTKIAGVSANAASPSERPVLAARSQSEVEGEVTDAAGNLLSGFNGQVTLQLYDAEMPVTTLGQGVNGVKITYNDRRTRLSTATAQVKEGRFKALLRVPPEIEGNFSPAMLAAYAWDGKGGEANGVCDRFYVYGWDENVTDTLAPEIKEFYVNNPAFQSGGRVNSSPVVFATLRDPSGINVSEGGIGHSITLAVDGSDIRSDLNACYTQDAGDPDLGHIVYPLTDLPAGLHTLTLTVWDNANNMARAEIDVNVGEAFDPVITDLYTDVNPARESVVFNIVTDRPNTKLGVTLGVYDLSGRKVWENVRTSSSGMESKVQMRWDLTDASGQRVPRGIYVYRAEVTTPEGTHTSKSRKLAVAAQ